MLKNIVTALLFALFTISVQAENITLNEFWLVFGDHITPEIGGLSSIHYARGAIADETFEIMIAPWQSIINNPSGTVDNWLTPVIGSNTTFAPVALTSLTGFETIYHTPIGIGYAFWGDSPMNGGMQFADGDAKWSIQVSSVPEPQNWILMVSGLLVLLIMVQKKKSELPTAIA